jgi:hypothetical protein
MTHGSPRGGSRECPIRRVEGWRGAGAVPASLAARGYWGPRRPTRFQLPPRQSEQADFPHSAFLIASHQGICGSMARERFHARLISTKPVVVEDLQPLNKPPVTPPLPAITCSPLVSHQMPPDLSTQSRNVRFLQGWSGEGIRDFLLTSGAGGGRRPTSSSGAPRPPTATRGPAWGG